MSKNFLELYPRIIEPYIIEQKDFCINPIKHIKKEIENNIMLTDVEINGITYQMIVPKNKVGITRTILRNKIFEGRESINFLNALNYYKNKKNIIDNKDIFMLDIGSALGWYPSFLGRYGFTILTFEPSPNNFYLGKKNYCLLNQNSNVIIINKGLSDEEKICDYYKARGSEINGMTLCENVKNKNISKIFIKAGQIVLTKLSNFIPYLSDKNLALIKIDVEGSEGKVINGGIELISKYHVPFIFVEFTPIFLKEHNTEPRKFIQLFIDNDYKISLDGFLSKNFLSVDELIERTTYQVNCYFIHKNFIFEN